MSRIYTFFHHIDSLRDDVKLNPYIFLLSTVVLATVLQYIFTNFFNENTPLLMYVMVPLITSWFGGFFAGLVATLISIAVADYFFAEPLYSILQTPREIGRMTVFLFQGIIISMLNELRNKGDLERKTAYENEKNARHEAENAKKDKDDFISMITHELKSPITSQKAFIQLLIREEEKRKNKTNMKYLTRIEEQTNKMTRLINDLLSLSKLQVGKLEMNFELLDINKCVDSAIEVFSIGGVKQKIIREGTCTKQIMGDKERVSQIIINLLSNASKYAPNTNEIVIALSENKRYVVVSVTDYGIGMSKKAQKLLFSKYYRVQGANEKTYKGFGMGLYIVSEIIKLHNGKIEVKSTEGKGSTFTVKLPVSNRQYVT